MTFNKMRTVILLITFVVSFISCEDYEFTILHTNDVHAHIEQFNQYGGVCVGDPNLCFGGVARRYTVIEQIRKSVKNVILLDGGDQFSGTLWFTEYKGLAAVRFMNYTKYDAMAIGNHEFDHGPQGLVNFLQLTNFSVVACNMNVSKEPVWPKPPLYTPSTILERGGKRIGIVGYTTPEIVWLSQPGPNIVFTDVITSVRAEAQKLKQNGIDIIIALGHAGYSIDQQLGKEVKELDLVVGGHTNTFLYNGPQPSVERIQGPYPKLVTRDDGTKCPVVQDFSYGKYLGNLKLVFDENGKVKSWSGNPLVLNATYKENPEVLKMVDEMDDPIIEARTKGVGRSLVFLQGDRSICRLGECNLGNLVVDAVVKQTLQHPDETQWATVVLGLWNSGGIRSGNIDKKLNEDITMEELNSILPFGNTASIIEIKGKYLIQAFQHGFSGLKTRAGRFPQISGFRLKFNASKPAESRLVEALALCTDCRVPVYEKIEDEKIYNMVTSAYLANGGDGYSALTNYEKKHQGSDALFLLESYFRKETPVYPANEGRTVDISKISVKKCVSSGKSIRGSDGVFITNILATIFIFIFLKL